LQGNVAEIEPRSIVNEDNIKGINPGDIVTALDENQQPVEGEIDFSQDLRAQGLAEVGGQVVAIETIKKKAIEPQNEQNVTTDPSVDNNVSVETTSDNLKQPETTIPSDEKGNMLFEQAAPEVTLSFLNENFEPEEVVAVVDSRISDLNKQISKISTFKPTGNIQKDIQTKQAQKAQLQQLNEQLGYWNGIKQVLIPKVEAIAPKEVQPVVQPVESIIKRKSENKSGAKREGEWGEVKGLRDLVVRLFANRGQRVRWNDLKSDNGSVISRGLGGEYRYSEAERRAHLGVTANDAPTPEQLAHAIWQENAFEQGEFVDFPLYGVDTQEILNEEIKTKFPEFNNNDNLVQSARDYAATSLSGKYNNDEELNSKFPEFFVPMARPKNNIALPGVNLPDYSPENALKSEEANQTIYGNIPGTAKVGDVNFLPIGGNYQNTQNKAPKQITPETPKEQLQGVNAEAPEVYIPGQKKEIERNNYAQDLLQRINAGAGNMFGGAAKYVSLMYKNTADAFDVPLIGEYFKIGEGLYNKLGDVFLNLKADEYSQRKKLQDLLNKRNDIIKDIDENNKYLIDNSDFVEGQEEIYRKRQLENPRIKQIDNLVKALREDLSDIDNLSNNVIWDNEQVNKTFNSKVEDNNRIRENASPENLAKVEGEIEQVNNSVTESDLDTVQSNNPIVQDKIESKKQELAQEKEVIRDQQRQAAVDEELGVAVDPEVANSMSGLDFGDSISATTTNPRLDEITTKLDNLHATLVKNGMTDEEAESTAVNSLTPEERDILLGRKTINPSYTELSSVEGSEISDDLTPTEAINNSVEELNSIRTGDIDNGKGVKVISTNKDTGEPFDFITQSFPNYLSYEREPINKKDRQVGFEINQTPGNVSQQVLDALTAFNNNDFTNSKLLYDYLPINVKFTDTVNAPIETMRKNGKIDIPTQLLRIEIISRLINGQPISNIKGSVQGQNKGLLKIDSPTAENSLLKLDAVKDNYKYLRDNLFVVNAQGLLQNIQTPETTVAFNNLFDKVKDRTKENAKGEIYLMIPQANGESFPLKLNIKKINEVEANILFDIYKEILTNDKSYNTTLSEIRPELRNEIETSMNAELDIIGGSRDDLKLFDIIDLMVYPNSQNVKSQMRLNEGTLYFGTQTADASNIDEQYENIKNYLINQKRHQIKISPKSDIDNTKTNLQSNSADYLKYLVDNKILSTNAIVNEPTFQGYTNIYLNPAVSLEQEVKPISNIQNKLSKINTLDSLAEAFSKLSPEQQSLYKQDFTNRKEQIKSGPNKVTDEGVAVDSTIFEGLSWNENNSDNTRNSEEKVVSLSEIPGTMENTQLEEVQNEVYEVPTDPRDRKQDIDRLVVLSKKLNNGKELRPNELRDYHKFKEAYPQEFEKRCK